MLRRLHRSPGFAATAILTLAAGIGAADGAEDLVLELLGADGEPGLALDLGHARRRVGQRRVARRAVDRALHARDELADRRVGEGDLHRQVGGHAAAGGSFSLLRFDQPDLPDVVYIEQLTSALYLDKPVEVDSYLEVMEQLCLQAEPVASTTKVLQQILADI